VCMAGPAPRPRLVAPDSLLVGARAVAAAWQARLYYQLALLATAKCAQALPLGAPGARTRSLDPSLCAAPAPALWVSIGLG